MGNFFDLNFWFNLNPGRMTSFSQNALILFLVCLAILSAVSFLLKKRIKNISFRFWERIFTFSSTNLIIGLILWFFNYETINFFSARFWYLLWLLGMATWLFFIIKYLKSIPERKKQIKEEKEYKKYIP